MKKILPILILSIPAVFFGAYFAAERFPADRRPDLSRLQNLELPDTLKKVRKGEEWLGQVVVINHWASWCAPCREEIPMLADFNRNMNARGVQVVGIAHDLLDTARSFGDEIGLNYPSLVAIVDGQELMRSHGSGTGALPFTAIFDRDGNLVRTKLGKLTYPQLFGMVAPYL